MYAIGDIGMGLVYEMVDNKESRYMGLVVRSVIELCFTRNRDCEVSLVFDLIFRYRSRTYTAVGLKRAKRVADEIYLYT